MKVFVFDAARCNGCHSCQIACKDEHAGNEWLPYALPQPETGQFWLKMNEEVQGSVPKVKIAYWPTLCRHCDNAPCLKAARDNAVYKREDGLVIIDPLKAKGQQQLVKACPYGAIYWNEELQTAQKCTGCAHLLDEGKPPRCVEICATEALKFGEEEELKELIAQAESCRDDEQHGTRVYYLNMPKNFLAGTVYDPESDEIIEGAEISLKCAQSGQVTVEKSDSFGDYWFKKLNAGTYSLKISKNGYKSYEQADIILEKSINAGDIPLQRL